MPPNDQWQGWRNHNWRPVEVRPECTAYNLAIMHLACIVIRGRSGIVRGGLYGLFWGCLCVFPSGNFGEEGIAEAL